MLLFNISYSSALSQTLLLYHNIIFIESHYYKKHSKAGYPIGYHFFIVRVCQNLFNETAMKQILAYISENW